MKANRSILNKFKPSKGMQIILAFSLMAILLAACAAPATQAVPTPQPAPTTTGQGGGMDTLPVARAKSFLAEHIKTNNQPIQIVDVQPFQWPDSCLGVQTPGVMCAMHVVDGFRIKLSVNGQTYELHSNLDGSQIVLAPASKSNGQS